MAVVVFFKVIDVMYELVSRFCTVRYISLLLIDVCVCGVRESVIECDLQCTGTGSVIDYLSVRPTVVPCTDCEYQLFVPGNEPGSMYLLILLTHTTP